MDLALERGVDQMTYLSRPFPVLFCMIMSKILLARARLWLLFDPPVTFTFLATSITSLDKAELLLVIC